ncbi:MAG: nucleotide exchange factor GrpE [Ignavibacteria bacterium]|nr:nucleotide exchange factor GrpE [Ignavibacteria bacterium]
MNNEKEMMDNSEEMKLNDSADVTIDASEQSGKEPVGNETVEKELAEWKDKFFRKSAEFENYKRRTEIEMAGLIKYGGQQIAVKILPVLDDLERSLAHVTETPENSKLVQGITLVHEKFVKVLKEQGIEKFISAGKPFDVNFHDALIQHETKEVPAHTVLQEILAGYMYKDKILRHAQVIVSSYPEDSSAAEATGQQESEGN